MSHDDGKQKIAELLTDARVGMFTTVGADGYPRSRPMTLQESEFDGDLWFFSHRSSGTIQEITDNPQVNASFQSRKSWLSVSGTAEIIEDRGRAHELWQPILKNWFPGEADDPDLRLIKVHAEGAEYWQNDDSTVVTLLKLADTSLRGTRHDMGDKETVDL